MPLEHLGGVTRTLGSRLGYCGSTRTQGGQDTPTESGDMDGIPDLDLPSALPPDPFYMIDSSSLQVGLGSAAHCL